MNVETSLIETLMGIAERNIGLFFAVWFYLDMRSIIKNSTEAMNSLRAVVDKLCDKNGVENNAN